ncbi:hypothetical protein [Ruminococcus sp.]|jgi:hypothetical protein|uniref:hypothetical protein n=1 Tax=Ruminococcus sp. TaxID=41978 RepID=UPI00261F6F15|nr:hypothetical protein [Ruminococcus sp.]MCI2111891.1 hypothetical protein [Ruminococcus sp.]MDD6988865.1 hypothetical protein [Ruminococcus sp.]MDY6201307.1 hypothetical protein [Ruminococcus sp.]
MVNTKQLSSFEKENINLTELKLDETDRLAQLNDTRIEHKELFDRVRKSLMITI